MMYGPSPLVGPTFTANRPARDRTRSASGDVGEKCFFSAAPFGYLTSTKQNLPLHSGSVAAASVGRELLIRSRIFCAATSPGESLIGGFARSALSNRSSWSRAERGALCLHVQPFTLAAIATATTAH